MQIALVPHVVLNLLRLINTIWRTEILFSVGTCLPNRWSYDFVLHIPS
jgi:hypothetical protein